MIWNEIFRKLLSNQDKHYSPNYKQQQPLTHDILWRRTTVTAIEDFERKEPTTELLVKALVSFNQSKINNKEVNRPP